MKNSRLLLVLFVILGLFGSDIYSMKRTKEETLNVPEAAPAAMGEFRDHKKEEKERKARNQDGHRLPVADDSDESMDEPGDQSDDEDAEIKELEKQLGATEISDKEAEDIRKSLIENAGMSYMFLKYMPLSGVKLMIGKWFKEAITLIY